MRIIDEDKILRLCDNCQKPYYADNRNLKRGWGLCCSKSCASTKREKAKPGYDLIRVERNNIRRKHWGLRDEHGNVPIAPSVIPCGSQVVSGYTSEGYRIMDGTAYDELDEPVYDID